MISGMTAFFAAVGGTSLVCYLLMNRGQTAAPDARAHPATARAAAPATIPAAMAATAGACSPGSAAIIPHPIIPAPLETGAVRTVEAAAVMAAAETVEGVEAEAVINPANSRENSGFLICRSISL